MGEGVDHAVLERQRLGLGLDQVDAIGKPRGGDALARAREHLGALIDSGHVGAVAFGDRDGDRAGSGGHVGDVRARRGHRRGEPIDQALVPAGVLAEAEQARPAVVVV